jgi:hypothetical protein
MSSSIPNSNLQTWAALTPFTPVVELAGKVRSVGKHNLLNSPNPGEVDFEEVLEGIRIPGWETGIPWIWYRRPTPVLTGDDYSATASYEAASPLTFD